MLPLTLGYVSVWPRATWLLKEIYHEWWCSSSFQCPYAVCLLVSMYLCVYVCVCVCVCVCVSLWWGSIFFAFFWLLLSTFSAAYMTGNLLMGLPSLSCIEWIFFTWCILPARKENHSSLVLYVWLVVFSYKHMHLSKHEERGKVAKRKSDSCLSLLLHTSFLSFQLIFFRFFRQCPL